MPMQLHFTPDPCSFSGRVEVGISARGMLIPSQVKFRVELQPISSGASFQLEPHDQWEVIADGVSAQTKEMVPVGAAEPVSIPISMRAVTPGPKSAKLVVTVLKTGDAVVECLGSPFTLEAQ